MRPSVQLGLKPLIRFARYGAFWISALRDAVTLTIDILVSEWPCKLCMAQETHSSKNFENFSCLTSDLLNHTISGLRRVAIHTPDRTKSGDNRAGVCFYGLIDRWSKMYTEAPHKDGRIITYCSWSNISSTESHLRKTFLRATCARIGLCQLYCFSYICGIFPAAASAMCDHWLERDNYKEKQTKKLKKTTNAVILMIADGTIKL